MEEEESCEEFKNRIIYLMWRLGGGQGKRGTEGDTWLSGQEFRICRVNTTDIASFTIREAFVLHHPLGLENIMID